MCEFVKWYGGRQGGVVDEVADKVADKVVMNVGHTAWAPNEVKQARRAKIRLEKSGPGEP